MVIRLNALDTEWGEADLEAAVNAGPDAILMPKVSSLGILQTLGAKMRQLRAPQQIRVWAMIETASAILDIRAIADAAHHPETRLECLVMGTNDLAKETRASRLGPRRHAAMADDRSRRARANGLDILDGVYNGLTDDAGFSAECEQGRECGFDGSVDPSEFDPGANRMFGPSPADVEWARTVVAAFSGLEMRPEAPYRSTGARWSVSTPTWQGASSAWRRR